MNAVSAHLLSWLFSTSVHVAVLVGLVLVMDRVSRRFLSAGWRHALWALALVPLVCPILPASSWSPLNLLRLTRTSHVERASRPVTTGVSAESASGKGGHALAIPPAPERVGAVARPKKALQILPSVLAGIWVAFALALLLRQWRVARGFRRQVRRGRAVVNSAILDKLAECRQAVGLHRTVRLLVTDAVGSPALTGVFRPTVLLPMGLLAELPPEEQQCLFLHELAHVKRWDLALDALAGLCQVVYWFNPVVHLVAGRLRTTREIACDARVLQSRGIPDWQRQYSRTLLRLAARASSPVAIPAMAGMAERTSSIEIRLRSIQRLRTPAWRRHVWGVCTLALVVVTGLSRAGGPVPRVHNDTSGRLTAKPAVASPSPESAVSEKAPVVTLMCHYVEVGGDTLDTVNAQIAKLFPTAEDVNLLDDGGGGIVSAGDLKRILQRATETELKVSLFPKVRVMDKHSATIRRGTSTRYATSLTGLDENGRPNPEKDADGRPALTALSVETLELGFTIGLTPRVMDDGKAVLLGLSMEINDLMGWELAKMKDGRDPRREVMAEVPLVSTFSAVTQLLVPVGGGYCFWKIRPTVKEAGQPAVKVRFFLLTPATVEHVQKSASLARPGSKRGPSNAD